MSDGFIHCAEDQCEAKIKNDRWSKTKAEGWFFQKDGKTWCPDHVPSWVAEWKRRKEVTT